MTTKENLEEIYLERARFLLSTDEMLEQILEDSEDIIYAFPIYRENNIRVETNMPLTFA